MVNGEQPDLLEGTPLREQFGAGKTSPELIEEEVDEALDDEKLQEEGDFEQRRSPSTSSRKARRSPAVSQVTGEKSPRQTFDGGKDKQKREQAAREKERTELEQFAIQEGVAPPRTREQREILRQIRDIREFEEDGFTPAEREVVELGQQQIEAAAALGDIEEAQEQIREAPEGTELVIDEETGRTVPLEEVREAELKRLESQERRARAALGDIEEGQEFFRERAELQDLSGTELTTRFFTDIAQEPVTAGEVLFFEPGFTASAPQLDVAREVAEAFGGESPSPGAEREAFEEVLPELTEVQRRFGIAEEIIEERTPEPVQQALSGTGPATVEQLPSGQFATPFFEQEIEQVTGRVPEFLAEEIPEKQTEFATLSLLTAEAATEPERLFEDIITGAPETVRRAVEDPVEFGVGEIGVDIGLDLITGGGVVAAQPQVTARVSEFFEDLETFGTTRRGQARLVPPRTVPEAEQETITEPEPTFPVETELEITDLFTEEAQTQAELEQLLTGTEQVQTLDTELTTLTTQEQAFEQAFTQQRTQTQTQPQLQLQALEQQQLQVQEQAQAQRTIQALLEPQPQPQTQPIGLFDDGPRRTREEQDFETLFTGGEEETDFTTSLVGEFFDIEETEELTEFTGLEPRRTRSKKSSPEKDLERLL